MFECCLQERGYLDTIFTGIGAVLGFQNCSEVTKTRSWNIICPGYWLWTVEFHFSWFQVVACRAGRMAADKLPGAAMAITMLETFVPRGVLSIFSCLFWKLTTGLKSWFGLMRNGVMGREDCLHSFRFFSAVRKLGVAALKPSCRCTMDVEGEEGMSWMTLCTDKVEPLNVHKDAHENLLKILTKYNEYN